MTETKCIYLAPMHHIVADVSETSMVRSLCGGLNRPHYWFCLSVYSSVCSFVSCMLLIQKQNNL